jgi:hypothetical protein
MPSPLRAQLDALSRRFAADIVAAIKAASVQELTGGAGARVGNGRRTRTANQLALFTAPPSPGAGQGGGARVKPSGRLARRSDDEIVAVLQKIVLLVKTHREGMRAEEIRSKLGLMSKEMPRILKAGLAAKKLTAKGQKRATTYFAK